MRNAVVDTATGALKRVGATDFTTHSDWNPGTETQLAISESAVLSQLILRRHHKVVAGDLVEMTAPEKAAADLAIPTSAIQAKNRVGAQIINNAAFQSVFLVPWSTQMRPLVGGWYTLTAVFSMRLTAPAVWGAAGADRAALARLTLNTNTIAEWTRPFDGPFTCLYRAGRVLADGATPVIDLEVRTAGTLADVEIENVRLFIERSEAPSIVINE